jgi:hypothetical protein
MGDITDRIFEGIEQSRRKKNLKRQAEIVDQTEALEQSKRDIAKRLSDASAGRVLGASTRDELDQRLKSYLDETKVGDAAAGADASRAEDNDLRLLEQEEVFYRRRFDQLRTDAVSAQARLLNLAPRPVGYEAPVATGARQSRGPLILTFAVGLGEALQTANFLSSRFSVLQSQIGGWLRIALILLISVIWVSIVMAFTFQAGRQLKKGVLANRGRKAESSTSRGGVLGTGAVLLGLAVGFQAVTLGARISTTTSDPSAQGVAVIFGLISFFGAVGVLVWEYTAYVPPGDSSQLVYTRSTDLAAVEEFRRVEERLEAGIERDKRTLKIDALRREERAIERLQSGAIDAGSLQMETLNARLETVRHEIAANYEKTFQYEPLDLDGAASTYASRVR